MSNSDFGHELLRDESITGEELLTQRSSEVLLTTKRDRESVTPIAKDVVENVITGALNILDISREEGKPWTVVLAEKKSSSDGSPSQDIGSVDEEGVDITSQKNQTSNSFSVDAQQPVVQVMHLRVRDDVVCDSGHAEQVARIVKGLQDIQIGDSTYVLPADGSNIEKQVKRAVRNINNLEFRDTATAQLIICDGQGDVDATILEAEVGPPSNANIKPQHDSSKVSTCFLHKMIEELEDDHSARGNSPDCCNKESVASWEESEEKFIRIIEGTVDERAPVFAENEGYDYSAVMDEESPPLGAETDAAIGNLEDSLGQSQQGFDEKGIVPERENGNRLRDLLDNYTDEKPYWSTAGLIAGIVSPQHSEGFASKTTMVREESRASGFEGDFRARRTEISSRENSEAIDEDPKVKGKKKKSFGRRLRAFFSRFMRSKDC